MEELKQGIVLMANHNNNGWAERKSQVLLSAQNQKVSHHYFIPKKVKILA